MEILEEEESNPDIKEKIPVSGKKHGILQWKLQKDQKKKEKEESEDISLEKFELEAKKMCQKYNQYTQRKEQEKSKVSSTTHTSQPRIITGPLTVRRIEVMPCDPGNHELKWNHIGLDSDDEDHNSAVTSMKYDRNNNIRRPAVTSMNFDKRNNSILPAILSTNYDNKHKVLSPVLRSKNSNNQQDFQRAVTLEDIDCDDSIPRPAVTLEKCARENVSGSTLKPKTCDSDQSASRPADSFLNGESDHTIPRPAVASMNLTKKLDKIERQRRRRRAKELKKKKPTRVTRTKSNKRYEEYFLDESEGDYQEDDDVDEEPFSLKNELALSTLKHFNRWQKQKVESEKSSGTEKDEQPESDIAKWVFDVLSISKVISTQAICEQISSTTSPPLPSEQESQEESEEEKIPTITPELEDAFKEYSQVDPDSISKPFTGSAVQISVSDAVQTLPNMVPWDGPVDEPIKHLHRISNEPITDDEDETENDGIMSITTRLIGKAIRNANKRNEVKPFRRGGTVKRELKIDDFRDEAPDKWAESLTSEYDTIIAAMRL